MAIEDILHPLLKHYTASPQWLKSSIGRAYSWLPTPVRYGRAFADFAAELRLRDSAEIEARRRAKLKATIDWALASVPAYAPYRHLAGSGRDPWEQLSQIPLCGKTDIKARPDDYLSLAMPVGARMPTFTGGSTANPMRFFLQRNVTRSREFAYVQDFDRRSGMNGREVILAMRGRSIPGADKPGGRLWMFEPIKRHLVLSSDHLEPRYMPQYVEALRQWRPTVIQAFPSALYPLARWLREHPALDVTGRFRCIQLTSENVYDYQLETLRAVFDCPVIKHYGHSERVLFGASLAGDARYFFWPLYGHLELVDQQGNAITQPGVLGEIVGTSFDNKVMPFVRYRTGDMGAWAADGAPGFGSWQVLERIEGRLQEFVVCRDQRLVSITTLGAAHFEDLANVEAIQYVQRAPGLVTLRVQASTELDAGAVRRIERAVREKTQDGCDVKVERVERIERTVRGKLKMLEQHIDLSRYLGASSAD